jgi:hypothetical protein
VFVLVASAGVLAPLVDSAVAGEPSRAPLDSLRGWMTRWNALIMSLVSRVLGLKLIGDAISGRSSSRIEARRAHLELRLSLRSALPRLSPQFPAVRQGGSGRSSRGWT